MRRQYDSVIGPVTPKKPVATIDGLVEHPFIVNAIASALLLAAALLAEPSPARAHALDEYMQSAYITLAPGQVTIEVGLTPGVLVVPGLMTLMDTDNNGAFSAAESQAYAMRVLADVALSLDGQPRSLTVTGVQMPEPQIMLAGGGEVRVTLRAALTPTVTSAVSHQVIVANHHAPVKSAHQIVLLRPKSNDLVIVGQKRNAAGDSMTIEYTLTPATVATVETASSPNGSAATAWPVVVTVTLLTVLAFGVLGLQKSKRPSGHRRAGQNEHELDARAEEIGAFWARFARRPMAEEARHEVDFLQESLDDLNRTIWRGLRGAIEQGHREPLRQVRQLIEHCRNDVRAVIANAQQRTPNP